MSIHPATAQRMTLDLLREAREGRNAEGTQPPAFVLLSSEPDGSPRLTFVLTSQVPRSKISDVLRFTAAKMGAEYVMIICETWSIEVKDELSKVNLMTYLDNGGEAKDHPDAIAQIVGMLEGHNFSMAWMCSADESGQMGSPVLADVPVASEFSNILTEETPDLECSLHTCYMEEGDGRLVQTQFPNMAPMSPLWGSGPDEEFN